MEILPLFCDVDDFCQFFEPLWKRRLLSSGQRRRDRAPRLCLSEVMTIIVMFHSSSYRNFRAYYTDPTNHAAAARPPCRLHTDRPNADGMSADSRHEPSPIPHPS